MIQVSLKLFTNVASNSDESSDVSFDPISNPRVTILQASKKKIHFKDIQDKEMARERSNTNYLGDESNFY